MVGKLEEKMGACGRKDYGSFMPIDQSLSLGTEFVVLTAISPLIWSWSNHLDGAVMHSCLLGTHGV
jgi:hypothetical protein